MSDEIKLSEIHVLDLLKSSQNAARFFLRWHTACLTCGFARFCTLEDVQRAYKLETKKFTEEVSQLIATNQRSKE